jgi:predicted nucleic acid-binding protein
MEYVDTSALLKAYVPEADSDAFVAWARETDTCCISPLTAVELHCAIQRRQRMGMLDARQRTAAIRAFDREVGEDAYRVLEWPAQGFVEGRDALERCRPIALRALDALHLAVALHYRCTGFATADRVQAKAARRLGFKVTTFFTPA